MKKIRIVAPAKRIEEHHIHYAINFLKKEGFEVSLGDHVHGGYNYFSGTEEQRLEDFQKALNDSDLDIILCARGGYGSVQLIDQLDFSEFTKKPKLVVGYSDITVFHNHIVNNYGVNTLHATCPLNFETNTPESLTSFLNALKGIPNHYRLDGNKLNVEGAVVAPIIGGNLAVLYSLLGTNSDTDYRNKILFIEDIGEAIYAVDRMFYALKKSGKLDQISGLIVGGLTNIKDSEIPYGISVEAVIRKHVAKRNIPVCFDFPAGHIPDNRALIIGKNASLEVKKNQVSFSQ